MAQAIELDADEEDESAALLDLPITGGRLVDVDLNCCNIAIAINDTRVSCWMYVLMITGK